MAQISTERVNAFLEGRDPMQRIITIETEYKADDVLIVYIDDDGKKRFKREPFMPFLWAKHSAAIRLFNGNRDVIKAKLRECGISVKALKTNNGGKPSERLENGYKFLFYANRRMSYTQFLSFFEAGGVPVYDKKSKSTSNEQSKEYLAVAPAEQFMIRTGKRLFKGYENYNDLCRCTFDLETQGLNPRVHRIDQIGIHTNRWYDKLLSVNKDGSNELECIDEFLSILSDLEPDIVVGHNSENFDWDFIIVRLEELGTSLEELSLKYFKRPIYKKKTEAVLKLGGEVEYYRPTIMYGHVVLDSLHAARRAQALDSNMKSSNLKYLTKYLSLVKPNRVYVAGDKISSTWNDMTESYMFNDIDGTWRKVSDDEEVELPNRRVTGRYIVERYLLDDLWETDKVEEKLNESNFLVAKLLPTTFTKACTMGTAGIWKLIMLAWSFENDLAIPAFSESKRFTGGLSRLLKTGFVDDIVKLDYNSLYPSIILSWWISTPIDIMGVMNALLEYVLTQREKYKGLKSDAGKMADKLKESLESETDPEKRNQIKEEIRKWKIEKTANDKKQLPLKILANSFFGSYGAPNIFPFGDVIAAEMTTCTGRMMLRLMISHFTNIGYTPIVGDTDGFNFKKPSVFRYTDENPYISTGKGRNSVEGKSYTSVEADVAEFEDLYLNQAWNGGINKNGLGIDEFCDSTINFSRKNYADLMPDGKTKKVGNTIKSRKMSGYLEKFIDKGVDLLLHGNGYQFLIEYYDYVEKIYNYQIPIRDIASKGNIKKPLKDYQDECLNTLTKAGSKKSRQAWYELAINAGLKPNVGDTIYYINTGVKKSQGDVKRVVHYYYLDDNNMRTEITKDVEKLRKSDEYQNSNMTMLEFAKTKYGNTVFDEDEIILNCKLVPNEILDKEEDVLCSEVEGMDYNADKYIDQFNKRITPLLVCFSKSIRDDILITDPKDKKYFTQEQSKLVSGEPMKEGDQDTYEALMTPEKKEIEFWLSVGKEPPFIKECGIDWDGLVQKFNDEKKAEENEIFKSENSKYLSALSNLKESDISAFEDEGKLPSSIASIMTLGPDFRLYFKKIPTMTPSTGGYVFDDMGRVFTQTD